MGPQWAFQQGDLIRASRAFSFFPFCSLPHLPPPALGAPLLYTPLTQVFVLALTFLILFLGNFLTTLKVVHTKLQENRSKAKKP